MNVMFNIWVTFVTFGMLALLTTIIILIMYMYMDYLIKFNRKNK